MTDSILNFGYQNSLVASLLALLAWGVSHRGKSPTLAYFLWIIVLIKLILPSYSLPILPTSSQQYTQQTSLSLLTENINIETGTESPTGQQQNNLTVPNQSNITPSVENVDLPITTPLGQLLTNSYKTILLSLWSLGSLIVLIVSIYRISRFQQLLTASISSTPPEISNMVKEIASKLNLKKLPQVKQTSANIPPMVWWLEGKLTVFLPSSLLQSLNLDKVYWVLAHELAHISRRDYLIRWLEFLATVLFWWNPLTLFAGKKLREYEEICCDNKVINTMKVNPHTYASSILAAIEKFVIQKFNSPPLACQINNGGSLKRRFQMIISGRSFKLSYLAKATIFFLSFLIPFSYTGRSQPQVIIENNLAMAFAAPAPEKQPQNIEDKEKTQTKKLYNLKKVKDLLLKLGLIPIGTSSEELLSLKKLTIYSTHEHNFQNKDLYLLNQLINLEYLSLGGVRVSDITPLKKLVKLKHLGLSATDVKDLTAIKEIPSLESLTITSTIIKNIDALKGLPLKKLALYVDIEDLTAIKTMPNLKSLDLSTWRGGKHDKLLEALPHLESLIIRNKSLENPAVLKKLSKLKTLTFSGFSDIGILKELTTLEDLNISVCQINNIQPLETLKNLTELRIYQTKDVTDITVLKKLPKLKHLDLSDSGVKDLKILQELPHLESLRLETDVDNLSTLKLPSLKKLILTNYNINDLSFLEKLGNLESLDLQVSGMTYITPLKKLKKLESLVLRGIQIIDTAPLKKLINLKEMKLINTRLDKVKINEIKGALPNCKITVQ